MSSRQVFPEEATKRHLAILGMNGSTVTASPMLFD